MAAVIEVLFPDHFAPTAAPLTPFTYRLPTGAGRIAPKDPELLELEARGEQCEGDGEDECENTACYGPCCFPPEDYGEFGRLFCHDHLIAFGFRETKHRHRYACKCGAVPKRGTPGGDE